jgi:putative NIF3 family GTP cyclohydrolase 1 type 2
VEEWRLELLCARSDVHRIVEAMRRAHSYEEPAYDIYPLAGEPARLGAGRRGTLDQPTALQEFAAHVKTALSCSRVDVAGDPQRLIHQVAVACGAGGDFIDDAISKSCDALVTGETSLHRILAAESQGLALILAGHYATERFAVEQLAEKIQSAFPDVESWASQTEREPTWPV